MTGTHPSSVDVKRLAEGAREAAAHAAELLREKTRQPVNAAINWASPRAHTAWNKGLAAAGPKVAEAAALLVPKIDGARDAIVDKALPAIVSAVDQAARGAAQALEPPKPRHTGRKVFLFTALGALVAGIGYWLWRQTRPIADPWAEDDWEAFDAAPEENLTTTAHDAADAVGEAAGSAVKKVTDVAKKAAGATKKAAKNLADTVTKSDKDDQAGEAEGADSAEEPDNPDDAEKAAS